MSKSNTTNGSFWRCPSTLLVTVLRLALIVLPHIVPLETVFPNSAWLYSPSLTFLLVKPHQTLSHVREARAIQQLVNGKFADAYAALSHPQWIRLPPLVLAALTPLLESDHPELYLSLILLFVDFLMAWMLEAIGRRILLSSNNPQTGTTDQEEEEQRQLPEAVRPPYDHIFPISPRSSTTCTADSMFSMESLPLLAAQLYYWSPITAVSGSLYHCFQNLAGLCLVASLYEGIDGSYLLAAFYLACATYMEFYHVVFLVPLWLWQSPHHNQKQLLVIAFFVWFGCLQGLSYGLVGPSKFVNVLQATYGCGWTTMSPNLSVQWYFAMQLFSRFRDYFGALLTGLPYLLVAPLTIRLYKYPMVLVREVK
jgi:hypothetical protein